MTVATFTVVPPVRPVLAYSTRTGDAPVLPEPVLSAQIEAAYLDATHGVGARFAVQWKEEGWAFAEWQGDMDSARLARTIVDPTRYYIRYRLVSAEDGAPFGEVFWG